MPDPKAALSDAIEGYFRALERDGYRPEGCSGDDLADVLLALPGVAVIQLPEPKQDPEWGDDYWPVELSGERPGAVRIDRTWKPGPRISQTGVPTPIRPQDVSAYVAALLAAAVLSEGEAQ